jgi:cobalt/nickel transport system permease protein
VSGEADGGRGARRQGGEAAHIREYARRGNCGMWQYCRPDNTGSLDVMDRFPSANSLLLEERRRRVHLPDGYLSPVVAIGMAAATVPALGVATQKVKTVLNNRTVPLLAIFAALSFTIMMFNIPVPGGTTAHGVGSVLIAVVLGPWAAVIAVSTALVIQALFFGDGGILAIFANCFTMAILMPFVGYWTYRVVAARASVLGARRAWAAAVGGYVGMTAAALAVGILLGIQPLLFADAAGKPLYSPYDLSVAVPAMLISHVFGASIVEGLIAGLGIAYFQKRHPEYLTSFPGVFADQGVAVGRATPRPLWQVVAASVAVVIVAFAVVGLAEGGGDPSRMFGADWSQVDWAGVASMLLVVVMMFAILVLLAYLALPRRYKRVGAAFTAIAVVAPLGMIAPGFAYGEGSVEDVHAAFGYIPQGLRDLSRLFSAPLGGYNIPLPFFSDADAELWHAGVGYEITAIIGMLLCGAAVLAGARLLGRGGSVAAAESGPSAT